MTQIRCIKDYQMVGKNIKADTILTEKPSKMGTTTYGDENGNSYTFDNSELIFSNAFRESFVLVN